MCCRCRRADGPHRKVRADRAEVSRGRSTGRDQAWAGKDRTSSEAEESVLLVLVAVIAATRGRGPAVVQTVSSVEHPGGA